MTLFTGFGEPAEPAYRRRTDTPAGISDMLKDSRYDPAEAGQPWSDRGLNVSDLRGYLARVQVYGEIDRLVPEAAELWRAVEAEVEPAVELALRLEELQGAEKRAMREYEARVRADLAARKTPPPAPKADHEAERDALRAQLRVRRERIEQARAAYREAALAAAPAALAKVAAGLEERRAKAAAALGPFTATFNAWRSDVAAADLLARAIDPDGDRLVSRTSAHAHETAAAAVRGVQAMQDLLSSDDPVTTGRRHIEPSDLEVPIWVRRAMWDSGSQRDLQELRALEKSEDFAVTALTRGGR